MGAAKDLETNGAGFVLEAIGVMPGRDGAMQGEFFDGVEAGGLVPSIAGFGPFFASPPPSTIGGESGKAPGPGLFPGQAGTKTFRGCESLLLLLQKKRN